MGPPINPITDPWDERYTYLHLVDFDGFHVGKYAIHVWEMAFLNRFQLFFLNSPLLFQWIELFLTLQRNTVDVSEISWPTTA